MATAFAVTGIHRSRLKYYRPSYTCELAPIYEDLSAFTYHKPLSERPLPTYRRRSDGDALSRCGSLVAGLAHAHDYEEIDAGSMDQNTDQNGGMGQNRSRSYSNLPKTNGSMLNGIMNNRFNRSKKPKTANYGLKSCEGGYKLFSNGSAMVIGKEPPSEKRDDQIVSTNKESNNNDSETVCLEGKSNNKTSDVDKNKLTQSRSEDSLPLNVMNLVSDMNNFQTTLPNGTRALPMSNGKALSNETKAVKLSNGKAVIPNGTDTLPMQNGKALCNGVTALPNGTALCNGTSALPTEADVDTTTTATVTEVDETNCDIKAERSSSLYNVYDIRSKDSVDYGVIKDHHGVAIKHWPKLEPEPPTKLHVLCPAERKMKHRCFAVCFVVLILLIGVFVTGIIEGWMYTETGRGFDGSKQPMFTMRGIPPSLFGSNGTDSDMGDNM